MISEFAVTESFVDSGQRYKTYPRLPKHPLLAPSLPQTQLIDALSGRNSASEFAAEEFTLLDISNLLSGVGIRPPVAHLSEQRRIYPSAGARYPAETYIVTLNCSGIAPGIYHYLLNSHELEELWVKDLRQTFMRATNDERIRSASVLLMFSLVHGRIAEKYGQRGLRYGLIEVGHMAQNISLVAYALQKECCEIGGFVDSALNGLLDIDGETESTILLMALGGKA